MATDVIKRFETYIDDCIKNSEQEIMMARETGDPNIKIYLDNISIYQQLMSFLHKDPEKRTLFMSYDLLVDALDYSDFSILEKLDIIMYFIDLSNILKYKYLFVIDKNDAINYEFKHNDKQKILDYIDEGTIQDYLINLYENKSIKAYRKVKELLKLIEISNKKNIDLCVNYQLIKNHYVDKYPNISEEDIQIFTEALNNIGIPKYLTKQIGEELNNKNCKPDYINNFLKVIEKNCHQFQEDYFARDSSPDDEQDIENLADSHFIKWVFDSSLLYGWLTYSKCAKDSKYYIGDLAFLEPICKKIKLSKYDLTDIVFYFIEKNIEIGILNDNIKHNMNYNIYNNKYNIDVYSIPLCVKYFPNYIANLFAKNYMEKPTMELKNIYISEVPNDIETVKLAHQLIQTHYLNKKDTYDESDIDFLKNALKSMNLADELIERIAIGLQKRLSRRLKEQQKESSILVTKKTPKISSQKPIKKVIYKELSDKLANYLNLKNYYPIKYLTVNDIEECLYILKRLKIDEDKLEEILNIIIISNKKYEKNSVYLKYYQLKNALHYDGDINLSTEDIYLIQQMDALFQERFLCSDEDYEFYTDELKELLDKISSDYFYNNVDIVRKRAIEKH